ncbi:hypothetical protein [Calidifontibacter terrae]
MGTVTEQLSIAHALVGHAMLQTGQQAGSASAAIWAQCQEIRNRLEDCGAEPDPYLREEDAGNEPAQLLNAALDALEEIPQDQRPVFLSAVWPMVAGVLLLLPELEGAGDGHQR